MTLYPAVAQLNGTFTQTAGTFATAGYHLHRFFALQLTAGFNWLNEEAPFSRDELVEKYRVAAPESSYVLWTWAVLSGAEVTPFTGSFELPGGVRGHLSFVVNVGLGAGGTRIPLSSASANGPATFGDTGVKFMGAAGAGFRVGLGRHVALRLEARNVMYSSAVESINGCSLSDMGLDDRNSRFRQIPAISQSCAAGGFRADSDSNDYQARESAARDARYAGSLLLQRSSDIAFNLGLYAGISFLF